MNKKAFTLLEIIIGLMIAAAVIFIVSKVIIGILAPEESISEGYYILDERINALKDISENGFIEFSITLYEYESIESFFRGEDRQPDNRCPPNTDCLCIVKRIGPEKRIERSYCVKDTLVKDPHSPTSEDLRVNLPIKYWSDCVNMIRTLPGPNGRYLTNPQEINGCLEKYGIRVIEWPSTWPSEPDESTLNSGSYMFTNLRMYEEGDSIYMCPSEEYC